MTAAFQRARYIALANHLRETGHAPDALGLQSHTGWVQNHSEQTAVYDQYGEAGWTVQITEFWAHIKDLRAKHPDVPEAELQELLGEYVANYLTVRLWASSRRSLLFLGLHGHGGGSGRSAPGGGVHLLHPVFHPRA